MPIKKCGCGDASPLAGYKCQQHQSNKLEWKDCKYYDDVNDILDMAAGADGCIGFWQLRQFLTLCEEQGTEVQCVHDFAKLCRGISKPGVI